MSDDCTNLPTNPPVSPNDTLSTLWDHWQGGDPGARDQLVHRLLPRLRDRVAALLRQEIPDPTSEVTAMVVASLASGLETAERGRGQLTCLATECMRRILVDAARAHGAGRRHGEDVSLEVAMGYAPGKSSELIQVDEALDDLATFNPDGALAVTLRYFGGLSHAQMASAMDLSEAKALMVWVEARAWLYMQFQPDFLPED